MKQGRPKVTMVEEAELEMIQKLRTVLPQHAQKLFCALPPLMHSTHVEIVPHAVVLCQKVQQGGAYV
jgi:hypothetical protein